jgi:hypothetical protein
MCRRAAGAAGGEVVTWRGGGGRESQPLPAGQAPHAEIDQGAGAGRGGPGPGGRPALQLRWSCLQ